VETQDEAKTRADAHSAEAPDTGAEPERGARSRLTTVIIVTAVMVVVIAAAVLFMVANRDSVVPDVSLLTESEAVLALNNAGFEVGDIVSVVSESVGPGRVVAQDPAAGATVSVKTPVALTLAEPSSEEPVPDVVSREVEAAIDELSAAQFVPLVYDQYSETVPSGVVVSQLPAAGSPWVTGKEVIISVSRGPAAAGSIEVPPLVGMDAGSAERLLGDVGLEGYWLYNAVSSETQGLVLAQAPEPGVKVPAGAKVAVWVAGQPEF